MDLRVVNAFWLLAALAVLGAVYSVLATGFYVTHWVALVPIEQRSFFLEILLRVFWSAVALAPITVVIALLRVKLQYAALVVLVYQVIMNAAVFAFARWNIGEFTGLVTQIPLNFAMQIPVWGLTRLVARVRP